MTYTTISGDMWDAIAYKTMGDVKYTDALMRLNSGCISTFVFPAGVVLTLPDEASTGAAELPPWMSAEG